MIKMQVFHIVYKVQTLRWQYTCTNIVQSGSMVLSLCTGSTSITTLRWSRGRRRVRSLAREFGWVYTTISTSHQIHSGKMVHELALLHRHLYSSHPTALNNPSNPSLPKMTSLPHPPTNALAFSTVVSRTLSPHQKHPRSRLHLTLPFPIPFPRFTTIALEQNPGCPFPSSPSSPSLTCW